MTLAIEPKFLCPFEGVVGIEDDLVIVGASGARYLSSTPREIVRIEV